VNGEMVLVGDQVVVGDTLPVPDGAGGDTAGGDTAQEIAYEVLCRRHHRRRVTRAVARASFSEPLPLGEFGAADDEP
jgi:thymidine kinase